MRLALKSCRLLLLLLCCFRCHFSLQEVKIAVLLPHGGGQQRLTILNKNSTDTTDNLVVTVTAFDFEYDIVEQLLAHRTNLLVSLLDCPLNSPTLADIPELLLDSGDCQEASTTSLTLQARSREEATAAVVGRVGAADVTLVRDGGSAGRVTRLLQLLGNVSTTPQVSPSDEAAIRLMQQDADVTIVMPSNGGANVNVVNSLCSITNGIILLPEPVFGTQPNCTVCQLSPLNVSDLADCPADAAVCDFAERLRVGALLTRLRSLTMSILLSEVTRVLDSQLSLNVTEAATSVVNEWRERQFLRCGAPGANEYAGVYDNGVMQLLSGRLPTLPGDVSGRELIVGLKMVAPFSYEGSRTADGFEVNVTGLSIDMLNEVASRLNFTYRLRQPADGYWGGVYDNGTWNGMIMHILKGEMDFAIGPFTMTAIRQTVIDFSTAFMEDGNTILIAKPGQQNTMFRVLSPFSLYSWLAILGSVLTAASCLFLYSFFSPFSAWNLDMPEKISDEVSFKENFWSIVGTFLQQGQDFYPVATSARFVLGFWWMSTVVILAYYTADMIGYLTLYIPANSVKSLEQLADQTEIRPVVKSGTNVHTLFQQSAAGSTYSKIYSLMHDMPVITETYQGVDLVKLNSPPYAYISDRTQLHYIALTNCDLTLLDDVFNVATFGWPMPKGAAFKSRVDSEIRRMIDSGIMSRWIQKWWRSESICDPEKELSDTKAIGLDMLSGTFIILAGFYMAGLAMLSIEWVGRLVARGNGSITSRAYTLGRSDASS